MLESTCSYHAGLVLERNPRRDKWYRIDLEDGDTVRIQATRAVLENTAKSLQSRIERLAPERLDPDSDPQGGVRYRRRRRRFLRRLVSSAAGGSQRLWRQSLRPILRQKAHAY